MSESKKYNLSSIHHSFDISLAEEYGIEEAILIHHLQHWISLNNRKGKNIINGKTWSYQTTQSIADHFPYLSSDKIRDILHKLENGQARRGKHKAFEPVIIKGNFNKLKIDKTIWFAFIDEDRFLPNISKKDYERVKTHTSGYKPNRDGYKPKAIPDPKTSDTKNTDIKGTLKGEESPLPKSVSEEKKEEVAGIMDFAKDNSLNVSRDDIKKWLRKYGGEMVLSSLRLALKSKRPIDNHAGWLETALKNDWAKLASNIPTNRDYIKGLVKKHNLNEIRVLKNYLTIDALGYEVYFNASPETFKRTILKKFEIIYPNKGF